MLETPRLQLLPYGPTHLLALIEGVEEFERAVGGGLRAAEGLRDGITSSEVSPAWLQQLRASADADAWLHGFGVVHRESRSVIGSAAFKGQPDNDGVVEIAYGIVPGFQRRGYATEAAAALVRFALDSGRVKTVRAHTSPARNPSTRVLDKCGFRFVGEQLDPEDGLVWRWERDTVSPFVTRVTATLSVRRGAAAVEFYKSAFGAIELHRVEHGGSVVAQLSVAGAEFWVADESPDHLNFSPESIGGCSVRMLLLVEDPADLCRRAVAAGACQVVPVSDAHGWRIGRILDPFGHHWEIARQLP